LSDRKGRDIYYVDIVEFIKIYIVPLGFLVLLALLLNYIFN